MSHEDLRQSTRIATELAWNAGRVTLRHYQTNFVAEIKSDNSPVTIADRESERLMRQMIEARYPHHSILGEEEGETRPGQASAGSLIRLTAPKPLWLVCPCMPCW
jgi:fructose-1,6-bisphosphatase/inositol monophosphatase family enzyme